MKAKLFRQDGSEVGLIDLPEEIFATKINLELVHRLLILQHNNKRLPVAHTLRRSEVAGTTKKSFRQKGTGQARKGAKTTPLDRGGGVAWGPRNDRSFKQAMPKKMRRKALFSALSQKAQDAKINVLESFSLESPSTKKFLQLQKKLPENRSLLVVHNENETLRRSSKNLPNVKPLLARFLNIHDLTKFDQILFEKSALEAVSQIFHSQKNVTQE